MKNEKGVEGCNKTLLKISKFLVLVDAGMVVFGGYGFSLCIRNSFVNSGELCNYCYHVLFLHVAC